MGLLFLPVFVAPDLSWCNGVQMIWKKMMTIATQLTKKRCCAKVWHAGDVHDCLSDPGPEEQCSSAGDTYIGQVGDEYQGREWCEVFDEV